MKKCIDYERIVLAKQFYNSNGFKYIDLPWTCTRMATNMTLPVGFNAFSLVGQHPFPFMNSDLVGSGEQSFLQMMLNDALPEGRYCGITPCFRDEIEDEIHGKYFLKLELIDTRKFKTEEAKLSALHLMIKIAESFHKKWFKCSKVEIEKMSYDLTEKTSKIEVGSYKAMKNSGFEWICGTGLAEPRFSIVYEEEKRRKQISKLFSHNKKVKIDDLMPLFENEESKVRNWLWSKCADHSIEVTSDFIVKPMTRI